MKVFAFSDIHVDLERTREIIRMDADVFILAGDLTDLEEGLEEIARALAPLKEKLWVMPGNNERAKDVKRVCTQYGFTWFHDTLKTLEDYTFFGLGYSNPTPFGTPGERTENEITRVLETAHGAKKLIIASHAPPYKTGIDTTRSGTHTGSRALRDFIEKEEPLMVLAGHIHENAGKVSIFGRTTLISLGKQGVLLEL
ncbi:hypothetical protein COT72_00525 [archaeon CG10_big_fil_rev_8_21_14_0_10_43_11]|nr:MAG: hypothetical protein COT72_00525 [archaeon CG10_big_fil_rev_8_21_14_0_10_43_11]